MCLFSGCRHYFLTWNLNFVEFYNNFMRNLFLVLKFLPLILREEVESLKLKCYPTHGNCARLKNTAKITDKTPGFDFVEKIRCKPLRGKYKSSFNSTWKNTIKNLLTITNRIGIFRVRRRPCWAACFRRGHRFDQAIRIKTSLDQCDQK